jgi:hypothetical protein
MIYRRLSDAPPPDEERGFTTTLADFAEARAKTLRARAERCWNLASTSYDAKVAAGLDLYARELEEQAEILEQISGGVTNRAA